LSELEDVLNDGVNVAATVVEEGRTALGLWLASVKAVGVTAEWKCCRKGKRA